MNTTTRRYPRSLREVGPWPENCLGIEKPIICCAPWYVRKWNESKAAEFVAIYRQYRRHHGIVYSARIAYGCVVKGVPF